MNLQEKYNKQVVASLTEKFGYKNKLMVPKIIKVTLNAGLGKSKEDGRLIEVAENNFRRISGQKPVVTLAKKAISAFKTREGMKVGMKVTLRGVRMWDFLSKLVAITLPRVRDFRGLDPKSIDRQGNLSIGFKEHIVFPEIKSDEVEKIHGLEVVITTTAKTKAEGESLFRSLGFPLKK